MLSRRAVSQFGAVGDVWVSGGVHIGQANSSNSGGKGHALRLSSAGPSSLDVRAGQSRARRRNIYNAGGPWNTGTRLERHNTHTRVFLRVLKYV